VTKQTDFECERRHSDPEKKKLRVVGVRYVPRPDANAKLSHAIDILLRAAARSTTKSEDSIRRTKSPAGDGLTIGEEGDPHE